MPAVVDAALSTVDAAISAAADARQSEANAAAQERSIRHRSYLEVLIRAKSPKKGDDAKLAELILSLGLTTDEVRRDSARINKAETKIPVIEQPQQADAAYAAALVAVGDMRERHRQELKEANDSLNRAGNEARRGGWYANDVAKLYHDAPELFADGLIKLPRAVAGVVGISAMQQPVERRELEYKRLVNGKMVEPIVGPDGLYKRENGDYVFPVKQAPEPLTDDNGRPVTDARGNYVFPSKE